LPIISKLSPTKRLHLLSKRVFHLGQSAGAKAAKRAAKAAKTMEWEEDPRNGMDVDFVDLPLGERMDIDREDDEDSYMIGANEDIDWTYLVIAARRIGQLKEILIVLLLLILAEETEDGVRACTPYHQSATNVSFCSCSTWRGLNCNRRTTRKNKQWVTL
jgi:hypothetical protein